ncbi:MAG: hypothetical protein K6F94_07795 [Bacteroidaceae bacterium]|nr:hypothetical protein [Bacteroidaceae bacterium]
MNITTLENTITIITAILMNITTVENTFTIITAIPIHTSTTIFPAVKKNLSGRGKCLS